MNTTDAEIADRLTGMKSGDVVVKNIAGKWLNLFQPNQGEPDDEISFIPADLLAFCRAVVSKVDGPAKPTDIERIIYALELWMKRIENGIPLPLEDHLRISGWQTRWSRMKKVIEDWKTKGEMPK